jgi:L-asparaginase II
MTSSAPSLNPPAPSAGARPAHVPLALQIRGGAVEGVHYGSLAATDADGSVLFSAGEASAPSFPRSALKPLQAVAMVRAGLSLPDDLLALAAASHSGAAMHREGTRRILALHGLDESVLANTTDLPYGVREREEWLAAGGAADHVCQNCSGKHAAMAAVCTLNGWPVRGYLEPSHPLQRLIAETVAELTCEEAAVWSTDGCGTPLPAVSLIGMARAYGRLALAGASSEPGAEAAVARAMVRHPEMVAGEDRDVTALMRGLPGAVAKDGFEGVQLVGLPDGRAVAVKVSDGGDRARMPVAIRALAALGVPEALADGALGPIASVPVLGGGRRIGALVAYDAALPPAAS